MKIKYLIIGLLSTLALASCNSNDDLGTAEIEIPGITINGDVDCCTAEEALQVYKFLQTLHIVPELSLTVGEKYNVFAYTATGKFHTGYNEVYFVATKKSSGNYVKDFNITAITPLMTMTKMNMKHSTPVGASVEGFSDGLPALKRGWVSFLMNSGDAGSWTLAYDASVLGTDGSTDATEINVEPLPDGQKWLQSFKVGDDAYILSLVKPTEWKTGSNPIRAYVSKKSNPITTPYALAAEQFTIDIDPRMPDMGHHGSPDNAPLRPQADGSYAGTVNLTMTGLWRIHLTVRDSQGNVVAGGDNLSDGFSSLYWDVTI